MTILFTPLLESHFPLLLKWLEAPHIKVWWDSDIQWTSELIRKKYSSYVQGYKLENGVKKPLQAYVIYMDTQPIGYIQLYNAHDFIQEDALDDVPLSLAALDFFIGEKDLLGKGLSAHILQQFLQEYVDPHYDACLVDPNTANIRAIRTYEKVGFKPIRTFKEEAVTWMIRLKLL